MLTKSTIALLLVVLASLPAAAQRTQLTAGLQIEIAPPPTGVDAPGCGTLASPCKSAIYAYSQAQQNLDLRTFPVTFHFASGTEQSPTVYTDGAFLPGPLLGIGGNWMTQVTFLGDHAVPRSTIIRPTSGEAGLLAAQGAQIYADGLTFELDGCTTCEMSVGAISSGSFMGIGNVVFGCGPHNQIDIQVGMHAGFYPFTSYEIDPAMCGGAPSGARVRSGVSTMVGGDPTKMGLGSPGGIVAGMYVMAGYVPFGTRVQSVSGAIATLDHNATAQNGYEPATFSTTPFVNPGCAQAHTEQDRFSLINYLGNQTVTISAGPCYNGKGFVENDFAATNILGVTWKGYITGTAVPAWVNPNPAGGWIFNQTNGAPDNTLVFTP